MRAIALRLSATVMVFSAVGCAREQPAPTPTSFKVVATVKQLMHAIVIPASDAVWKVPDEPPKDDAEWLTAENNALALAESGNLLLMAGRAVDDDNWTRQSTALTDSATMAVQAAQAKDVDGISDAGNAIYEVCEGCHKQYMPQQ